MLVWVIKAIDQSIRGTACLKGAWKTLERPGVCSGNMEGQFKETDIPHSCLLCASYFFPSHPSCCFNCAKNPPELCHNDDGSRSTFVGLVSGELGWLCCPFWVALFQLKWFMICSFAGDKRVVCDFSAEGDRHGLPSAMHSLCPVTQLSEACVTEKPLLYLAPYFKPLKCSTVNCSISAFSSFVEPCFLSAAGTNCRNSASELLIRSRLFFSICPRLLFRALASAVSLSTASELKWIKD